MKSYSSFFAMGLILISVNSMAKTLVADLKSAGDVIDASAKKINDNLKFFTSGDGLNACNDLKAKVDSYNYNSGEITTACSKSQSLINDLSSSMEKAGEERKALVNELNVMIERASWSDGHISAQANKSSSTLQSEILAVTNTKNSKSAQRDQIIQKLKDIDSKYANALKDYKANNCSGSDYDCEFSFINLQGPEVKERASLRATRDSLNADIAVLEASLSEKKQLLASDVANRIAAGKQLRADAKAKIPSLKSDIKAKDFIIDSQLKARKASIAYLENTIGLKRCQEMGTKQLPVACVQIMK